MAKKRKQDAAEPPPPADALPQRFDVWQADARPMDTTVRTAAGDVQPWLVVVVSRTEGDALAFELTEAAPDADGVWAVLEQAMRTPQAGDPHRPTEVQLPAADWAAGVRDRLAGLGVAVTEADTLEEIDELCKALFSGLQGMLSAPDDSPGLLDMEGMTPALVAGMYDAAAAFHQQAPWKKVGERPIRIETAAYEGGPWFAVLLGQGGMTAGLALYDDLDTILRIQESDAGDEESASETAALAITYSAKDEVPPADLAAVAEHGWKVAGEDAYPWVYRMDPGLELRPPEPWELGLMEACLRAIPAFVKKKTRRVAPLELTVPAAGGEVALTLAWAEE